MVTQNFTQLQEVLKETLLIAREFGELLFNEKKQLTSKDREEINALLPQKELLINQLAGMQTTILGFCEASKIEPSYSALRAYLYRLGVPTADAILEDWTQLKNQLIKNQALNKTNQAILNELIRRNQIKQQIVHNLGRQTDTYSAKGQQTNYANRGWVEQV
ncbi:flagellar export chaperone FlgN [Reinekea thalattae]|uniref:Flagellar protein FlgN n=1 Tax=Reinekea thalattae TaxID=2593301 RepID=A0A5C8Z7K7_9GAMM|nr:flagellar export chaperone FlgN [Reinekea thalattae]TXR53228.1 flagellar protein FlgN [Reinekea thalattae]